MANVLEINQALQVTMKERCLNSVTAVKAAAILDEKGVLKDSDSRPGASLRNLLRKGSITGARQDYDKRWYVHRVK